MLAKDWQPSFMDPTGWLLSEKFDGVRAVWNGETFFSKQGNEIRPPEFITQSLPAFPLDGEFWYV
jgi:DNA ligase-1